MGGQKDLLELHHGDEWQPEPPDPTLPLAHDRVRDEEEDGAMLWSVWCGQTWF